MKKAVALLMVFLLVGVLWVPASAATKPEKRIVLYFEMPDGMNSIPFAGLPDLTGHTLVLKDNLGFTKRFLLPDQSDLLHYTFSDSEGTGSMDVIPNYSGVSIVAHYETKTDTYIATYAPDSQFIPFDNAFVWNEPTQFTAELTDGQAQKVNISRKHEANGFLFKTAECGWYSFKITGDTSGHPYIIVRRGDMHNESQPIHALDFICSYAHSVSIFLDANETVYVAATTLGGCFTGSFDVTAAPAALNLTEETIKVRYHGIVPWGEILADTTYEPRDLRIVGTDGGLEPIATEGWNAVQRGEYAVTILAPDDTGEEDTFKVKVEYDVLQWLCVIFLGGFIWLKWTPFRL